MNKYTGWLYRRWIKAPSGGMEIRTANTALGRTGQLPPAFSTQSDSKSVIFKILMAVTVNNTVFWDVIPSGILEIFQRFGGTYCFNVKDGIMPDLLST
jgi:hypothetical protein